MSRAWYLTALVPLAIGVAIAWVSFTRLVDNVESMQRMVVPGERTFILNGGDYILFGETASIVDGTVYRNDRFAVSCSLAAEDGTPIALERTTGRTRYSVGSYAGGGMFEFTLTTPGTVKLSCDNDGDTAVVAIGGGIGAAIVVGIVCLVFGLLSAIGVFAIVFVRRRRMRQRSGGIA